MPLLRDPLPVPSASKGASQRSWTEFVSSQPSSDPLPPPPNPTAPPVEIVQSPSPQSQPLPHSKHTSQSLPQTESSNRPKRTATQNKDGFMADLNLIFVTFLRIYYLIMLFIKFIESRLVPLSKCLTTNSRSKKLYLMK